MSEIVLLGDALEQLRMLESESIHTCITSPPYYNLRDYGAEGQIGVENTPEEYIGRLVNIFREVRRVLRDDGTLWVNIGDTYAANRTYQVRQTKETEGHVFQRGSKVPNGCKQKDLIGVPWMLAFALRADGWYLRQDIIWQKPNCMPESVKDRCTKSHEHIFLLTKSPKYYFDHEAIKEPAKNRVESDMRSKRDVWIIPTHPFKDAHFATFPEKLVEPCILAGSPDGGTVLDPFTGSGTTGVVAKKYGRNFVGVELNPEYRDMAVKRINATEPNMDQVQIAEEETT